MAARIGNTLPVLGFNCSKEVLNRAFRIAAGDFFGNIIPHKAGLVPQPRPMIMAGLDYDEVWTRDAAINCWNAGSMIAPGIARDTLLGVLENTGGQTVIGGQYWDKIIWVTAAWHHYLVTGDDEFLRLALEASGNSMRRLEADEFDPKHGLFRGGACFQDGISGYPDRYAQGHQSGGPITRWAETNQRDKAPAGAGLPMMAGSTNCLYYSAYRCISAMQKMLGMDGVAENNRKAESLKKAIRRHLWNAESGKLAYMIDPWEVCARQEGLGLAFALIFGILEDSEAALAIQSQFVTPCGIPCVWPSFARYDTSDGMGFGRHSGTVWPHVQGFWGEAVARHDNRNLLVNEVLALAGNADRDAQFAEIYHPVTGLIYGGRQEFAIDDQSPNRDPMPLPLQRTTTPGAQDNIEEWRSCRRQTWSATALLRMIITGLIGMRFDENGISWQPQSYDEIQHVQLAGLHYRRAILNIKLSGSGSKICSFIHNGRHKKHARMDANLQGLQTIEIELCR
jgi:glycogen debranching enzyme